MNEFEKIRKSYKNIKDICRKDWTSQEAGDAIIDIAAISLKFLEAKGTYSELVSKVPNKKYFTYKIGNIVARPANKKLFIRNVAKIQYLWNSWIRKETDENKITPLLYTIALAPCLAMELFDRQNKKGPATYFEHFIGYLFSSRLRLNPRKDIILPIHNRSIKMTMDFLFDAGPGRYKIHLPVKMSTRERVVQAWAHQRLLDSAYGEGTFKGIMILFSETKLDSKSLEVIEICVPDQWLAYQSLLSKLEYIFYFDPPDRYIELSNNYPTIINIKPIKELFTGIEFPVAHL